MMLCDKVSGLWCFFDLLGFDFPTIQLYEPEQLALSFNYLNNSYWRECVHMQISQIILLFTSTLGPILNKHWWMVHLLCFP
jgi:hypothetical protein